VTDAVPGRGTTAGPSSSGSNRQLRQGGRRTARLPWLAIATFLAATAVALVLIAIGATHAQSGSGDLHFELAKAGIQLLAIVIFGGAVAAGFRSLDARRDERRRIDDYLASMADELLDAYHHIKAVRRALRAAGFRNPKLNAKVTQHQVDTLEALMAQLDDAQLRLEKLARQVEWQSELFDSYGTEISKLLRTAEQYIRRVLRDWEHEGSGVSQGAEVAAVVRRVPRISSFVGSADADEGLGRNVSKPVDRAAAALHSIRFGTQLEPAEPAMSPSGGATSDEGKQSKAH
jgi:hypothetical protein